MSDTLYNSLVIDLGLQSTLAEYKVPKEDFPQIASQALGKEDDPRQERIVNLLNSIYEPLVL